MSGLRRAPIAVVAIAAMCGMLAALAWQQGGYFPPSYLHAGAVGFALLAAVLLAGAHGFVLSREAALAIGALLAFAVWTWIATGWSATPTAGAEDAQRDLVYLAIFGVAVTAAGSGRSATFAVWCALVVAMVIVCAGLGSRLDPSGVPLPPARDPTQYRLSYPLTYWNAFGALAGMAAVLAGGLAADRRTPLGLRSLAAAMSVLAMVAMYLSLSRGAWLAALAGVVVLLVCSPTRGAAALTVTVIGLATTAAILALSTALVDNPLAGSGEASAGRHYLPKLIVLAALAAGVQAVLVRAERAVRGSPTLVVAGRRLKVAVIAASAIGALVVLVAAGTAVAGKFDRVDHFVSRQWDDFMRPAGAPAAGSARLVTASTTRGDVYRVALDDFTAHPLFGSGAGSFSVSWYEHRRYNAALHNAHSLYLETLAELGIVGFAILLAFIAACVMAAIRARRRPTAVSRGQATAVIAATSVWLIHAGVDWDWQMAGLTGLALFLVGTLFPLGLRDAAAQEADRRGKRRHETGVRAEARRVRRRVQASVAGAGTVVRGYGVTGARLAGSLCAVAAIYTWVSAAQAQRSIDAGQLGASGQYQAALAKARSVTISPASTASLVIEAFALQDLGRRRDAAATYARAAAADPGDWSIRINWATDLAQEHRWAAAYTQFNNALQLNPLLYAPRPLWRFCYFTRSFRCLLLASN